jgi:hypothetical protein
LIRPDGGGQGIIDRPDDGRPGVIDRPGEGGAGTLIRPDGGGQGIIDRPGEGGAGTLIRPDGDRPGFIDRPGTGGVIDRLVINRPVDVTINYNVTNVAYLTGLAWTNVVPAYQYFYGPSYAYPYDWYYYRHITYPTYYVAYPYDPLGECFTEYYLYQSAYYCYVGPDGASGQPVLVPLPPEYLVGIDVAYHYYYGPTYAYEDDWYFYRHLNAADWYSVYDYDPFGACTTYYYLYEEAYYCFAGV